MVHMTTRIPSLVVPRPGGSLEFSVYACSAAGEGEATSVMYKRGGYACVRVCVWLCGVCLGVCVCGCVVCVWVCGCGEGIGGEGRDLA